jgi:hypothetical protein
MGQGVFETFFRVLLALSGYCLSFLFDPQETGNNMESMLSSAETLLPPASLDSFLRRTEALLQQKQKDHPWMQTITEVTKFIEEVFQPVKDVSSAKNAPIVPTPKQCAQAIELLRKTEAAVDASALSLAAKYSAGIRQRIAQLQTVLIPYPEPVAELDRVKAV